MALIAALVGGAAAQAQIVRQIESREVSRELRAVGRLDMGGGAFCSGTLIGPDRVLTAAHCLIDTETGLERPLEQMRFLIGWRNGRAEAERGLRSVDYTSDAATMRATLATGEASPGLGAIARDIAVLTLERSVRLPNLHPLPTSNRAPMRGEEVVLAGYGRSSSDVMTLTEQCPVEEQRGEGVLVLLCTVEQGNSGGPVLRMGATGPEVVAVISGRGARTRAAAAGSEDGQTFGLAALLHGAASGGIIERPSGPRVLMGGGAGTFRRPGQ